MRALQKTLVSAALLLVPACDTDDAPAASGDKSSKNPEKSEKSEKSEKLEKFEKLVS